MDNDLARWGRYVSLTVTKKYDYLVETSKYYSIFCPENLKKRQYFLDRE